METLGKGAQGTVYQVANGRQKFALKVYNKNDDYSISAQRRARKVSDIIMEPRTGALNRAWSLDNGSDSEGNPVMLYKLFPYRPIEGYHRPFDPPKKFKTRERMVVGLTAGLVEIHQNNIIHADLAPINVLYSPIGEVAIIDFDGAGYQPKDGKDAFSPTVAGHIQFPNWVAPAEVGENNASFGTDIWWTGAIIMKVLTNYSPFFFLQVADGKSLRELHELIGDAKVEEWPPKFEIIKKHRNVQPSLTPKILDKVRKRINRTIATNILKDIFVNYERPEDRPSAVKLWTGLRGRVFK